MSTGIDKGWKTNLDPANMVVHVTPNNDLIEHEESPDCSCKPDLELIERKDDHFGQMYSHNAIDGRSH
ncbi:hypothetical protein GJ25_gp013 [Mycobacterium phage Hawkeye]|uniref:Uncharacterized protein n=1 Tax=Mycobacterium phage Hawkeye TaxID=1458711 RepID=X2KYS8_9CAUD|nr:hypothetical protein GJ25_gp013 [Mycobacterium phage Hawkeye]AHN84024.1 hypothetical protein PBI_HAWKEYE_13 [Mycobacterium phage Hawkeye]